MNPDVERKIVLKGGQNFPDKKEFDRLCHIWQREIGFPV